jgi:hypothetical protein
MSFFSFAQQVSIGSQDIPAPGVILKVNNISEVSGGEANSTGGLLLPRVALVDLESLEGISSSDQFDSKVYTGMIVYNVTEKLGKGLYVWDGTRWASITGSQKKVEIVFDSANVIVHPLKTKMTLKVSTNTEEVLSINGEGKGVVTYTSTNDGKGNYEFVFTSNPNSYGDEIFTFKIGNTNITNSINISNINLLTPDRPLRLGNDTASEYESSTIVEAIGGNKKWNVLSYSNTLQWDLKPENVNGMLKFKLKNTSSSSDLNGFIIVGHDSDPTMKKQINIVQNNAYIRFPDYDFMVIKYSFQDGYNLDTYTELMNTGDDDIDGKPMSPSVSNSKIPVFQELSKNISGQVIPVLKFGGEINTNSAPYEETLFYGQYLGQKILNSNSPKVYDIKLYATWWSPQNPTNNKVKVEIFLYKGGRMVEENNTFVVKDGGVQVYRGTLIENYSVKTYRGNAIDQGGFRTSTQNLGHLEYEWQSNNCTYIPPSN